MNVENLNKVINAIKNDRDKDVSHFKMGVFSDTIDRAKQTEEGYQLCNTAMCVAGWANTINMIENNAPELTTEEYFDFVEDTDNAASWLDISNEDADHIFYMRGANIGSFDLANKDKRYAAAIEMLEHFRDTGEANWLRALRLHGLSYVIYPSIHDDE